MTTEIDPNLIADYLTDDHHDEQHDHPGEYDIDAYDQHGNNIKISMDDSMLDTYRDVGSGSYPSLHKIANQNFSKSFDDNFYPHDLRMRKIAEAEENIRREMFKECTFRPRIKGLPTCYGPLKENGTPFVARVDKWHKEKQVILDNKKKVLEKSELEQCTFKPKINKMSEIAAKENQGDSPEPVNERLFKSFIEIQSNKDRLKDEEELRELKLHEKECTFQPKIFSKSNPIYSTAKPRFLRVKPPASPAETEAQQELSHQTKECTFTPKVAIIFPCFYLSYHFFSFNDILGE